MAERYRTPGCWTVEVVQLTEGDRLRIRHHGFFIESSGIAVDGRGPHVAAGVLPYRT
jgi:hypothetical protein